MRVARENFAAAIQAAVKRARKEALGEAATLASAASMDPQSSVTEHWPVQVADMNDPAKTAAHMMAQGIAAEIRALATKKGE
jgi:hypothetical protein